MSKRDPELVGIAGGGGFGTALAELVARGGRRALIWSRSREVVDDIGERRANSRALPEVELSPLIEATRDSAELAARARFIVLAARSTEIRDRLQELGAHLDGQHVLVHAIGALSRPGEQRVSELIAEETPVLRCGVLAGPAQPSDLLQVGFASMVAASRFDEVTGEARRLLSVPPKLRVYCSRDLVGVELSAVLSSAYALAMGLAFALNIGPGARAVLLTRIVAEGTRLVGAAGGESKTFAGLSGLGNILSRSSVSDPEDGSPSFRHGVRVGRGEAPSGDRTAEGVFAVAAARTLAGRLGERVPVLEAVAGVIEGGVSPEIVAARMADTVALEE